MSDRTAKTRRCRSCRRNILRGLDEDRCAVMVDCDPEPVSLAGEAIAILSGRKTYMLRGRKLYKREWWNVAAGEALGGTIVPAHVCGAGELPKAVRSPHKARNEESTGEEPPY